MIEAVPPVTSAVRLSASLVKVLFSASYHAPAATGGTLPPRPASRDKTTSDLCSCFGEERGPPRRVQGGKLHTSRGLFGTAASARTAGLTDLRIQTAAAAADPGRTPDGVAGNRCYPRFAGTSSRNYAGPRGSGRNRNRRHVRFRGRICPRRRHTGEGCSGSPAWEHHRCFSFHRHAGAT